MTRNCGISSATRPSPSFRHFSPATLPEKSGKKEVAPSGCENGSACADSSRHLPLLLGQLSFIILCHRRPPRESQMWWQKSIHKITKLSLIWMNCSFWMKTACGTKSQLCKDNHYVVDLRLVLRFGTSAAAAD